MPRRIGMAVGVVALIAACGGTAASPSRAIADPAPSATTRAGSSASSGGPVQVPGGFDFDRVRLMDATDLPPGIPVPVPFGGVIDDTISVTGGESLVVDYDLRFFPTAAAFYPAWIQREGLTSSRMLLAGNDTEGWEIVVAGKPVKVRLSAEPDRSRTRLVVTWD